MSTRRAFLGSLALPAAASALGVPFRPARLDASALDVAASLAGHPGRAAEVARDEDF